MQQNAGKDFVGVGGIEGAGGQRRANRDAIAADPIGRLGGGIGLRRGTAGTGHDQGKTQAQQRAKPQQRSPLPTRPGVAQLLPVRAD